MRTHFIPVGDRRRAPLRLSLWDEPLAGVYSGKCWFFSQALDADQVVSGLEGALNTLPSLMGRLCASGNGRHHVVFDSGRGARIDIVDRPGRASWPRAGSARRSVRGLMPSLFQRPVDREVPLLWARVTRFGDGRSALGVVYSHGLLDGGGSARLGKAWASACHGRPLPEADDPRERLDELRAGAPRGSHSGLFATPSQLALRTKQQRLVAGTLRARSILLAFDRAHLEALASEMRQRVGDFVSPLDVLTGAVGVAVAGQRRATISAIVDMRRQLEREFSNGYIGNLCISPVSAVSRGAGLDDYALAVRRCVLQATPATAKTDLEARSRTLPRVTWPRSLDAFLGHGLMQDSWVNPVSYELDFGAGKPEWLDLPDWLPSGALLLLPDHEGNGRIFAIASLDRKRIHRLEAAAGQGAPVERGTRLLRAVTARSVL